MCRLREIELKKIVWRKKCLKCHITPTLLTGHINFLQHFWFDNFSSPQTRLCICVILHFDWPFHKKILDRHRSTAVLCTRATVKRMRTTPLRWVPTMRCTTMLTNPASCPSQPQPLLPVPTSWAALRNVCWMADWSPCLPCRASLQKLQPLELSVPNAPQSLSLCSSTPSVITTRSHPPTWYSRCFFV